MSDIVAKLWGFCHTLRHDGIDYGDYIEQITYLLFLKMADERALDLPEHTDWAYLRDTERHRPHRRLHRGPSHPRSRSPASSATSSAALSRGSPTQSTSRS